MRVAKWGNSLAVRLPSAVVDALALSEGDEIDVHVLGEHTLAVEKSADAEMLLKQLRKYRGRLPEGFHFDRLEANERS